MRNRSSLRPGQPRYTCRSKKLRQKEYKWRTKGLWTKSDKHKLVNMFKGKYWKTNFKKLNSTRAGFLSIEDQTFLRMIALKTCWWKIFWRRNLERGRAHWKLWRRRRIDVARAWWALGMTLKATSFSKCQFKKTMDMSRTTNHRSSFLNFE